ncbi:MAG: histidine phosphatase family protein [Pseudomonadales bacterium]
MSDYGVTTAHLIADAYAAGATHVVALMRHSARTFDRTINDLENRLTDAGRAYARGLGEALPAGLFVRGYASPPHRCMETAELVLEAYHGRGGRVRRARAVEGLGVFYALDQIKMWKGMNAAGGLVPYLQTWFDGKVPSDAMIPPLLAAQMVLRVLAGKLDDGNDQQQLDLCVSHDITVHLVRDRLLRESIHLAPVEFLDALVLYRHADGLWLASHHGAPVSVDEHLHQG